MPRKPEWEELEMCRMEVTMPLQLRMEVFAMAKAKGIPMAQLIRTYILQGLINDDHKW